MSCGPRPATAPFQSPAAPTPSRARSAAPPRVSVPRTKCRAPQTHSRAQCARPASAPARTKCRALPRERLSRRSARQAVQPHARKCVEREVLARSDHDHRSRLGLRQTDRTGALMAPGKARVAKQHPSRACAKRKSPTAVPKAQARHLLAPARAHDTPARLATPLSSRTKPSAARSLLGAGSPADRERATLRRGAPRSSPWCDRGCRRRGRARGSCT